MGAFAKKASDIALPTTRIGIIRTLLDNANIPATYGLKRPANKNTGNCVLNEFRSAAGVDNKGKLRYLFARLNKFLDEILLKLRPLGLKCFNIEIIPMPFPIIFPAISPNNPNLEAII